MPPRSKMRAMSANIWSNIFGVAWRTVFVAVTLLFIIYPMYLLSDFVFDYDTSFLDGENVEITDKVYLDISIEQQPAGRIVLGLFGDVVPKTVENFIKLTERKDGTGFRGNGFHRVVPGFVVQAGEGLTSIYGGLFGDENFNVRHSRGSLSMANAGRNSNNAQFFITMVPTPLLNGKHVVFGRVLEGMDVVSAINKHPRDTGASSPPKALISECGVLNV